MSVNSIGFCGKLTRAKSAFTTNKPPTVYLSFPLASFAEYEPGVQISAEESTDEGDIMKVPTHHVFLFGCPLPAFIHLTPSFFASLSQPVVPRPRGSPTRSRAELAHEREGEYYVHRRMGQSSPRKITSEHRIYAVMHARGAQTDEKRGTREVDFISVNNKK